MKKNNNKGFTLIELMFVVAIAGLLASLAVPSFSKMMERNRLKEAVESLKSDLIFTRTEAIKQSTNIQVSVSINGSSWCYGINDDNTTCDCSTANDCALKEVDGSQFEGTTLLAGDNFTFDFRRGTASAGGSTLSTSNYSARVRVSGGGRVTVCYPDNTKKMAGYDDVAC